MGVTDVPVEDPCLDLTVEAIQGDVVLHELLHLELVSEIEGCPETTPLGNGEADESTSGPELETADERGISKRSSSTSCRFCGGQGHRHPRLVQLVAMVSEHMLGQNHAGGPQLPTAPSLQILMESYWLVKEAGKVESRRSRLLDLGERGQPLVEGERRELGGWRSIHVSD
jgi:hypothetical protein